jgi:DNA-directed RNA polymerase specialized sigma24 family protein
MGVVIVVLPDASFGSTLCREMERAGFRSTAAEDWASAVTVASTQECVAVVFDPATPGAGGVSWRDGLRQLRTLCPDAIALTLGPATAPSTQTQTQPSRTQPNRIEPNQRRPGSAGAVMTGRVLPEPIAIDIRAGDISALALELARVIGGATKRREFKAWFDDVYARHEAGDRRAGDELWVLTRRTLAGRLQAWAVAHGPVESREGVEDVLTDAILKALAPGCYDPGRILDPQAWVFTIAQHLLQDRWRRDRSRPRIAPVGLDVELDDLRSGPETGAVAFDDPVEREEARQALMRRIREITTTPGEVRLLIVRYLEGAPMAAQAAALGAGHLSPADQQALVDLTQQRLARRGRRLKPS